MRENGMSSNASTSAVIKRSTVVPTRSGPLPPASSSSSKCKCCPFGFHIDLGFVNFAQDVSNGFISRQGTPTTMHHKPNGTDRQLMSPIDHQSVFSDSLENLMSDFDDIITNGTTKPAATGPSTRDFQQIRDRHANGYSSDYTVYRRGATSAIPPPTRPSNLGLSGNGPTKWSNNNNNNNNHNSNGYSTALAKTVSEIRARNAESPFPDGTSGSRVGTPIDLGFHQQHHQRFHHDQLPPSPSPIFRRAPSHGDISQRIAATSSNGGGGGGGPGDFASLRRGREYTLPDTPEPTPRTRFFSASPKLPRKLQLSTPKNESHFTYSHRQNGATVLARTQSTSTSQPPSPTPTPLVKEPTIETRSIATTTGPLPAPKPCSECPRLKESLQSLQSQIPIPIETTTIATSTAQIIMEDKAIQETAHQQSIAIGTESPELKEIGVSTETKRLLHVDTQTEKEEEDDDVAKETRDACCSPIQFDEPPPVPDPTEPKGCLECEKRQDVFTRNVGVGSCSINEKMCVKCDQDVEETDENEAPGFQNENEKSDQKQRDFEIAKANAVKKLLTQEQKSNFQRGTAVSKSARFADRKKSVDDLDYIIDKAKPTITATTTSIPENSEALKAKVQLKKDAAPVVESKVPEPVAARIPRPKISKWAVAAAEEMAETPDEQEEAQDRLTPLRSEMRYMGRWTPRNNTQQVQYTQKFDEEEDNIAQDVSDDDSDAESDCSANSGGTFEVTDEVFDAAPFEISDKLREALENVNSNLLEPGSVDNETVNWSQKLVQHEWMKIAARKGSRFEHVDRFIEEIRNLGPKMMHYVVNLSDQNDNSALHYAVSHANFPVVSSILDSAECELDNCNKAGYTAVMLAALSTLEDDLERAVVHRLFEMGDVNARATQHGQTALMLAVSHGKCASTELLLQCGADVNIQDEEGSTALMCAAEHGHRDIVKMLLSKNDIDASLTDCDSSTALSIAVENGHRDIGVLIYAHLNYAKLDTFGPTSTI